MNRILKSLLIGAIIFGISFLLLKNIDGVSALYIILISFNFALFAGLITYEILVWNTNHNKGQINTKAGLVTGLTTAVIMVAAFIGVRASGDFLSDDIFKIQLLVVSTGFVGVSLGMILKYFTSSK